MINIKKDIRGVTLVELIIAMAISVIVMGVLYSLFFYGMRSFQNETTSADNQTKVRMALNFIGRDIRRAEDVEVKSNAITLIYENGNKVKYEYDSSKNLIRRGTGSLIEGVDSFTVSENDSRINLEVKSLPNINGHSIVVSSEIILRE